MNPAPRRRRGATATATAVVAAALVLASAASAAADTSTATATAARTTALGTIVTSAPVSAANDGTQATDDASGSGPLAGQSVVTAGLAVTRAVARADGTSAACAGLVGAGGSIAVSSTGACTYSAGSGVTIALSSLVKITADAVLASCTASSAGPSTTRVVLANAQLASTNALTGATTTAALTAGTTSAGLLGVAAITAGAAATSSATSGPVSTTALDASLLGGAASARIGSVTCGRNVVVVATPAVPVHGLPVLAAGLGAAALAVRRSPRARGVLARAAAGTAGR